MIRMQGKGVAKGVAHGTLAFYESREALIPETRGQGVKTEKARLEKARRQTTEQLLSLAERCREEMGEETGLLFETHAMLAEDEDLAARIESFLERDVTAEYAVQEAGREFAAVFSAMDDPYMNARSADVRDVAGRILDNLTGRSDEENHWDSPVILVAEDLTPSETVKLDKSKILAFVMKKGSAGSHTAILARTMGIPALCGVGEALSREYEGQEAYLDGESGLLVIAPEGEERTLWEEKLKKQARSADLLEAVRGKEDVAPDGRRIKLYCNVGSVEDVVSVLENDGRGIGLFRSEFLYLASRNLPSEERQLQTYRSVVEAMGDKRVIIRTLDIGADKSADYFGLEKEENPALGLRGIRLCLSRPEVLRTQLRAIYRASAYGRVSLMFPMISSAWEVEECIGLCRSVMAELDREGLSYDPAVEIGIMIETPASVWIADELAELVDFFSLGTNDLTQYTLACDRQAGNLGPFLDTHHPAVLRAIEHVARVAHRHGIWVGICGELAAEEEMLPYFLSLGIDELSVAPGAVLPLRAALRQTSAEERKTEKAGAASSER